MSTAVYAAALTIASGDTVLTARWIESAFSRSSSGRLTATTGIARCSPTSTRDRASWPVVPATRIGRIRFFFLTRERLSQGVLHHRPADGSAATKLYLGGTIEWCVRGRSRKFLAVASQGAVALSMRQWHSAGHDLVGR